MKRKIAKEAIKIASFTSFLLIGLTFALDQTLRHLKNKNRSYSAYVAPYPYVLKNYLDSGLNDADVKQLLIETTPNQGWRYEEILGFTETPRSGQFVNVSPLGFRRNNSTIPKDSLITTNPAKNDLIYFFGGSTTFGYGVSDNQTIPSQLEKLRPGTQVINFGRGYYYSEQENLLLDRLLNNGAAKPKVAIFLDGLNEGCTISTYKNQLQELFARSSSVDYSWRGDEILKPYVYSSNKLLSKLGLDKDNVGRDIKEQTCSNLGLSPIPIREVFSTNIKSREAICKKHGLPCLTFLQPLPGVNAQHNHINPTFKESLEKKYLLIAPTTTRRTDGLIDISESLSGLQKHAFIDDVHYSPEANAIIANEINKHLNKALKED